MNGKLIETAALLAMILFVADAILIAVSSRVWIEFEKGTLPRWIYLPGAVIYWRFIR